MVLGKKFYIVDIEVGFDLLMIDLIKDFFEVGKVILLEIVLERMVDLIVFCEEEWKKCGLLEIGYEVGMEEINGGLILIEMYEKFIM